MSLPATYKKLVATKFSKDFRDASEVVEVPFPEPASNEIVIQNYYAGVNATDPNISAGLYTPGQTPPIDLGSEVVGVVVAKGSNVDSFKIGDAVMTLTTGGGYREYSIIQADRAIPIPAPTPEIMTLVLSGCTASVGLEVTGEMKSGETVLVTAAAGGTGHIAVQLAKLAGNHVIGTCGTAEKAEMLKQLGCDRVVNYREESLDEVLTKEYPRGVNLIYESVGREMFDTCVKHLARFGRLVIIGYVSEYMDQPEVVTRPRIYSQLLWKSASIRSMFLPHFFNLLPENLMRLSGLLQSGQLHIAIDDTVFTGVEECVDAVEYLHSGKSSGKVVVRFPIEMD
ncbi:MAG: zinc-binding dehydrogenase [Aggregatilineales bacterium]